MSENLGCRVVNGYFFSNKNIVSKTLEIMVYLKHTFYSLKSVYQNTYSGKKLKKRNSTVVYVSKKDSKRIKTKIF